MNKRGKDRGRFWSQSNTLIVLAVLLAVSYFWTFARDPVALTLRYGDFKQVLQAPGVVVQKLRVSRSEIRGEIVTRDRVGGLPAEAADASGREAKPGDDPARPVRVVPFRTPRTGMEFDEEFHRLLDRRIGAGYAGDETDPAGSAFSSFIVMALMLTGLLLLMTLLSRWAAGGQSPFSFGRSRHKLYADKENKVTFQDVAGIDEAVGELREVVDFLKRPEKYQALGGRIPKGVLLVGPPGTGKTLLAKAVAGEAGVPFFSLSGSDFVEMFVGVGASRVRDLFREAESKAPCIIFIDELDALGKSRGGAAVGGHDEREQTLNQLLVEMDGFDTNRGVIIMAATTRPETLDAALMRPGRFDRQVVVDRPDVNGREAILRVHSKTVKMAEDVDLRKIAALTPGSAGADLANLVNEAALLAARVDKDQVHMADFNEAVERGAVGLERKSRIMRPEEKRRVAYHEAGHALVACANPNTDPVHKVSIIPRGYGTLGYVLRRPDDDRHLMLRSELEGNIKVALGGTLAEELIYGEISNGATSDLEKANMIASRMVKQFGMSRMGRIYVAEGDGQAFLRGMGGSPDRDHSEETAREIDHEVRRIIDEATNEVRSLLQGSTVALRAVAEVLYTKEVIDGPELLSILTSNGFTPDPDARRTLLNGEPSGVLPAV